ncbi:MAG: uracil-xanthine permease family protein [Eubacteriales bacterium]
MKLIYNVNDKPKFSKLIVFAIQQLLAIMVATITVPLIVSDVYGFGEVVMSPAAALFGAGAGTLIYVLFTKGRSPVFLGSSFAFISPMIAAFAGASTMALGYLGLLMGAIFAGLVYVIISIVIKFAGVNWLNKLMPAVVIGPTVAIIGLSLAGSAISNLTSGSNVYLCILCGIVTLIVTILCSTFGKGMPKLIPFICGIGAGYVLALIFTIIGNIASVEALQIISFAPFQALLKDGHVAFTTFLSFPDFTFLHAFGGFSDITGGYVLTVFAAYVPVAFVVFAEHIADHKNISSIIEKDLLDDPGLDKTLLGDGVGSMVGAFFGGCPNTTYGESVACVAITRNASVLTIIATAILSMAVSFISPLVALIESVPSCVMGGVCIALYGFISVSGLKMLKNVDLGANKNLFVVSTILICGIGGLTISFGNGAVTISAIACALILGIIVNLILGKAKDTEEEENAENAQIEK